MQTDSRLYRELAATPACDHRVWSPMYPVRGCRWCQLSDALDHHENAEARRLGQPVPNVIGAHS